MTAIHQAIKDQAQHAEHSRLNLEALISGACPGPHKFVQHRDRKPKWCEACGYAVSGERVKVTEMGA